MIGLREILWSSGSFKIKLIKLTDYFLGSLLAFFVKGKRISTIPVFDPKRILIIRPGGIGDAIFILPFLRALKKNFPSTTIDILCERRNRQVFSSQTGTHDQLYCYDRLKSFFSILKNKYDLVIDTEQWHYLSALTAYFFSRQGQSIGFVTRPLRAKLFSLRIDYEINSYELVNFQKLFSPLLKNDLPLEINNCFEIKSSVLKWAQETIPRSSICVFVGASIPERRLTFEQSLELIQFILSKNHHAILLGGKDIEETGKELEGKIHNPCLRNFTGKISLEQSAALIKQSKVFVGPDSGLLHLACAVGTPSIGIFGPGNLKKWSPQGKQHTIITENAPCSPCTQFGYTIPTCQGSYFCMRDIKIKSITDKISDFLSTS